MAYATSQAEHTESSWAPELISGYQGFMTFHHARYSMFVI